MKANYFEYNKLFAKEMCGVGLTNERLNKATESLRTYLAAGGANHLCTRLGIGIRTWERGGKVEKRRIIYTDSGKELTFNEIRNIGMFLRGGPCHRA